MHQSPVFRLPARALAPLIALLVALAFLPPAPVAARVVKIVALDDTQNDFGAGLRTLTSVVPTTLSNDPNGEPLSGATPGSQGGLAMAAVRSLDWKDNPGIQLPIGLAEMGAVTLGQNIWLFGGATVGGAYIKTVYRGTIDNTKPRSQGGGALIGNEWATQAAWNLPATTHSSTAALIAERTRVAAAARPTSGNAGTIYLIGGVAQGLSYSSDSVLIGDVDANGNLTWRASQPYKLPLNRPRESANAFVHTTATGNTFLYVVGGARYDPPFGNQIQATEVFYTKINVDGSLDLGVNNRTWQSVLLPENRQRVFNTAVTVGTYTDTDGALQDMFFVYGGQNAENAAGLTEVLKGQMDPTTGAITWVNSTLGGTAALPVGRYGHGAVEFNDAVYVVGGVSPSSTDNQNTFSSYIEPDTLTLYRDGVSNINFFSALGANGDGAASLPTSVPDTARVNAGVVLVPTTNPNLAFAYLIGGTSGANYKSDVYFAEIGAAAVSEPKYPSAAYFYSEPASMLDLANASQATVRQMTWLTNINPATSDDVKIEYLVYTPQGTSQCTFENARTAAQTVDWITVTAEGAGGGRFSKVNDVANAYYAINSLTYNNDQLNSGNLPAGNCFQYRATLTRGANQSSSPVLLRLGMEVIVPGNPDLVWKNDSITLTRDSANMANGVIVKLYNENTSTDPVAGPPTQPADLCHINYYVSNPGAECNPDGTFFIDVLIFPPGVTPITPQLPLLEADANDVYKLSSANSALAPYHRACLQVLKSDLPINGIVTINAVDRWSDVAVVGEKCEKAAVNQGIASAKTLFQFFDKGPGTYKVILVADSDIKLEGLVIESDAPPPGFDHPSERNNVSTAFDVVIGETLPPPPGDNTVYLPMVVR